jgi:hypothetical protein
MDFIKKRWLLIVFGLIGIVAFVAVFITPLPGMFDELDQQVDRRAEKATEISRLLNANRQQPDLDPESDEPGELTIFPTKSVVDEGRAAVEAFQSQAEEVKNKALSINRRVLLVNDSLPLPANSATEFIIKENYHRAYQRRMNLSGTTFEQTLIADPLNGTYPLTGDNVVAEQNRIETDINRRRVFDDDGNEVNAESLDREMEEKLADVERVLMFRKAQNHAMYVDRNALDLWDGLTGTDPASISNVDIFYSQLGLWVQQDIAAALAAVNGDSSSVATSPVKHLISIEVDETAIAGGEGSSSGRTGRPGQFNAAPVVGSDVAVPVDASATLTPDYGQSVTGRKSNPMYDVVPYTIRLRIAAAEMPRVLKAFGTNRLMSVRNISEFSAIDNAVAMADGGFVYGDDPVVEIVVEAEALFLREWLVRFIPDGLKAAIAANSGAAAGGDESDGM